jgi:hypothetical protein
MRLNKRSPTKRKAVGFYRDEKGRTRPIVESKTGGANRSHKIVPSKKFKPVSPKNAVADKQLSQKLEEAMGKLTTLRAELEELKKLRRQIEIAEDVAALDVEIVAKNRELKSQIAVIRNLKA